MISKDHPKLSIVQQCIILGVSRSGLYYKSKGENKLNLELMRLMDEQYMKYPFMGSERMHTWLTMDKNFSVNRKRIDRLYYKVMGLRALMPGVHTTKRNKKHKVYPYLLKGLKVKRPNQVWQIDITYIPMQKGFMYLVAVIDIYSRYVVSWSVSNTMQAQWCKEVVQEAILNHGKPDIINTDQGSQFTSEIFTELILSNNIKLSMDGKGRALDNIFIERLWRSVKYESIYLNPPTNGKNLYYQLKKYFDFYNNKRRHQGIENIVPADRYKLQLILAA